jgi:hypothetical protein
MSTEVAKTIEEMIDELHREAATAIAQAADSQARFPHRRHDVRIYRERAEAALQAVKHLEGEL